MSSELSAELEKLILNADDATLSRDLCDICQQLDIRELLSQSEAQASTTTKTRLTGLLDEFLEYKPGLPEFCRYHNSLGTLESSAKTGCTFCNLIWKSWSGNPQRSESVDKAIDDAGQGQLFVGTSSHSVSKAEMPIIIVTQKPDGHSSRTLCTFDAFSDRGELIETNYFKLKLTTLQTPCLERLQTS